MPISSDLTASLVIVLVSALILHVKSHVKFIALGLFIGLVLAEAIGGTVTDALTSRLALDPTTTLSVVQISLLALPALILGHNHTVDKQKWGFLRTVTFVAITTLFLLSSVISFLPLELKTEIIERSIIAAQLQYFRSFLLVAVAILAVYDSFHHRRSAKKHHATSE